MAEAYPAAIDVRLVEVEIELPDAVERLRRERLVQLYHVDVVRGHPGLVQRLAHRGHGAYAHDGRLDAGHPPRAPAQPRSDPQLRRPPRRHDDHRGRAVVDR